MLSNNSYRRDLSVLTALVASLGLTGLAEASGPLEAFTLRSSQEAATEIEWRREAVQAAAANLSVEIRAFPLTAQLAIDLTLEPFSVTGPTARFVAGRLDAPDEPLDFDPRSLTLFRGSVVGMPNSRVFLALGERLSTGYIDLGSGEPRYRIASKDVVGRDLPTGRLSVFRTTHAMPSLPPGVPLCGLEDPELPKSSDLATLPLPARGEPGPRVGLKHLELAVDTDFEFFQLFDNADDAAAYLVALYAEVSTIFQRDVDVWVDLVFARIWMEPDPFDGASPLPEFRDYWNNNMGSVHRDTAQLLSGRRDYPFGGQAWVAALCSSSSGYSVVGYAMGFFPDPSRPSPYHYDVRVTAHELGHSAGTGHTHSQGIDECDDPLTQAQRGTLMSYCSQTFTGLNANTDAYFHSRIQQSIDTHVSGSSCIVDDCNLNGQDDSIDIAEGALDSDMNSVPDECEDCNGNGIPDGVDIASGSADFDVNGVHD